MRNSIPMVIIALIPIVFLAGTRKEPDYTKILPGVVKVTDRLYYDQTEATNLWWLEYMYWTKNEFGKDSEQYKAVMPDSNVWVGQGCCDAMKKLYLKHEAYRDYPVVGITQTQAMKYCAWRTDRVLEMLEANKKLDKAPDQFIYRLPTLEEWNMMYADLAKLPLTIAKEEKRKCEGCSRFNLHKRVTDSADYQMTAENFQITAPAESYWPNQYKVYNVVGNVSEWVQEENTHIGGSWFTYEDEDPAIPQQLDNASSKVGFRCVCEIVQDAS